MTENVILVDEKNKEIGQGEKMEVHRQGKLHRAFSVFVFNSDGQLLIQKRAKGKYHCGGLWTNTCCSHPRPSEAVEAAAKRRLWEEMGIECGLKEVGHIVYRAAFDNGLIENEFDHIFVGRCNDEPQPDADEADDYRWAGIEDLMEEIGASPEKFTPWLRIILEKYQSGEIKFD